MNRYKSLYMLPSCISTTGLTVLQRGGGARGGYPSPAAVPVTPVSGCFSSVTRRREWRLSCLWRSGTSVTRLEICPHQVRKLLNLGTRRPQEAVIDGMRLSASQGPVYRRYYY